jgi:hypothetical protein
VRVAPASCSAEARQLQRASALTDAAAAQIVLVGPAAGEGVGSRELMLSRVRKMTRDEGGAHRVRMLEGFTVVVPPHGFAHSAAACRAALDNAVGQIAERVQALKSPDQAPPRAPPARSAAAAAAAGAQYRLGRARMRHDAF